MANKRTGIFGGTFDPPHLGHLLLAETIRESFALDEVLFVPSNEPPHKQQDELSSATHRYAMVVAATLHNPSFSPSPIEVNRPGKSYSIETVRMLEEEHGRDTELFFVAGLDSFLEIRTWRSYEELLDLCHFIVVSRPKSSFDELRNVLPERVHERIVDGRGGAEIELGESSELKICLTDDVLFDVSSTEIRARVRDGRSVRYRVTPEVERYIATHSLYQQAVAAGAAR